MKEITGFPQGFDVSRKEIRRYLGYRSTGAAGRADAADASAQTAQCRAAVNTAAADAAAANAAAENTAAADAAIARTIEDCVETLLAQCQPRALYEFYPLRWRAENTPEMAGIAMPSLNLSKNLRGCTEVCFMAATLGQAPDRLIARASITRMSAAVTYQAASAAMIEEFCDRINRQIADEAAARGRFCRPRFSPGYGDLALKHQEELLRLLDTPKRIGLTLSDALLMTPSKSVTALIGLSETAQPCHTKGCEACDLRNDCAFARTAP